MARQLGSKNKSKDLAEQNNNESESFASKSDLDKLVGVIGELAKSVNELKDKSLPVAPIVPEAIIIDEAKPDLSPVPPSWRKMVDEILGHDFGVNVSYPDKGSGFLFKIIVPMEKSNMTSAQRDMCKVDIRTKAIGYNEGTDGVKKYIELVAINLKKK